jgi:hypothetical protein
MRVETEHCNERRARKSNDGIHPKSARDWEGKTRKQSQKKRNKNAPIPFHNPRVIPQLQRQVLVPNEFSPEICALERVGGGWARLFLFLMPVPVCIAVVKETVVEEGHGGERGAR